MEFTVTATTTTITGTTTITATTATTTITATTATTTITGTTTPTPTPISTPTPPPPLNIIQTTVIVIIESAFVSIAAPKNVYLNLSDLNLSCNSMSIRLSYHFLR